LYEKTISFIKKHEGFAGGRPYYCAAGHLTIGYGHVIKAGENFGGKITKKQADRLLRKDFNKCLKLAEKHTENLSYNQLLAVSHFIYANGIGRYLRSTLKTKIDSGESPDEEFLKWCNYHTKEGKLTKSRYCLNIRQWEVNMFNGLFSQQAE
jgi:lysozyme